MWSGFVPLELCGQCHQKAEPYGRLCSGVHLTRSVDGGFVCKQSPQFALCSFADQPHQHRCPPSMWCSLAVACARIVQVQLAEVASCVCCRSAVGAASCPLWLSFLLLLSVAAEAMYQTPATRSYNPTEEALCWACSNTFCWCIPPIK